MVYKKLSQGGFIPVIVIVGIILSMVGGVVYYQNKNGRLFNNSDESGSNSLQVTIPTPSTSQTLTPTPSTVKKSTSKSGGISPSPTPTLKPNTSLATTTPVQVQPTSAPTSTPIPPTPTPIPPVTCQINVDKSIGSAPLIVTFVYGASYIASDGYVTNVQWDFNGDGNWDTTYDTSNQHPPPYTFSSPGSYTPKMHLQTQGGRESGVCTTSITVN